jgi:putative phage-type endonuclease
VNHEEWLAKRKLGVTGTDIGIIMGVSPWKKTGDLIRDKLGLGEPFTGNAYTECGQLLEDYVATQWSKEFQKILTPGEFTYHDEHKFIIGTPDFLYPEGGLEIKTGGESSWKRGIPRHYMYQCQWYSLLTGRKEWHLSVLIVPKDRSECPQKGDDHEYIQDWCSNRPRRDFEIPIDQSLQEQMVHSAQIFLLQLEHARRKHLGV